MWKMSHELQEINGHMSYKKLLNKRVTRTNSHVGYKNQ